MAGRLAVQAEQRGFSVSGTRVATTPAVTFSARGDAQLVATVVVPKFCPVPAVLNNPATGKKPSDILTNIYIGFDGKA